MSVMWFMLPLILGTGLALLAGLIWAIRNGQFEDVEDEKHRIFFER